MAWLEKMNAALGYIEKHLSEKIDYDLVAYVACCSLSRFQRFFSFVTDIPLSEYVKRRRLTTLRSKTEDSKHSFIETVRNIGYRFIKDR